MQRKKPYNNFTPEFHLRLKGNLEAEFLERGNYNLDQDNIGILNKHHF